MKKTTHSNLQKAVVLCVGFMVLLFCLVGYRAWWQAPVVGPVVPVTITANDAVDVTSALQKAGIIKNPFLFRLYFAFNLHTRRIKIGGYEFHPGTPYVDIVDELIKGVPKNEVQVQVIEGWTVSDIQKNLVDLYGVSATSVQEVIGGRPGQGSFDAMWRSEFPFLKNLPSDRSLEGYLFPDTYRVWKEQLPEALVRKQLQQFQQTVTALPLTEKSLPLKSIDDVVKLASIIEKEVATEADRRLVAGVFLTRLREGMALQSDATIEYVTQSGRAKSTAADLQIRSAFNTYRHTGLPPAPINNPSLSAIEAVLNPDIQGYRYFLTDKNGKVYYAKTLQQHISNRVKAGLDK